MWGPLPLTRSQEHRARKLQSASLTLLLAAHLPAVWFSLLVGLFTYKYHDAPIAPWFAALIGLDIVLVSAWPVHVPARTWTKWEWLPMFAGLAAVGLGVGIGIPNNTTMEAWFHVQQLPHHSDVLPSWDPRLAADAGVLHFAPGAALDVGASAGYRAWPHTYCAAPVVDNTTGDGDPVGFFAVGRNCCDRRGGFACDGAEDPDVRTGVRVTAHALNDFWTWQDAGDNFRRAARMSAAANGKELKEPLVLLIWTSDVDSLASSSWWWATGVFIVCLAVSVLWCGLGSIRIWSVATKQS